MKILALVGSLRQGSLNAQLVAAAADLAPEGVEIEVYDGLADLPFYDQDLDEAPPASVERLRRALRSADAVIAATPEYNGSVSGVLKNAIDWASRPRGAAPLAGKPTLVLAASPSPRAAQWAREDLARILGVVGADVVAESVGLPNAFEAFDGAALVHEPTREQLRTLLAELVGERLAA